MIMPRAAERLLLPANPWFIGFTLIAALMIDMVPVGRVAAMPDVLAVVLVFWGVHQPRRVGVLWAFVFGLLIDVHDGALLGQHALAYSGLSFCAIALHRRLPWFSLRAQSIQVLPLFFVAHALAQRVGDNKPVLKYIIQESACAVGLNKGEPALLNKVNEILTAAKKSGELNGIVQKWLNVPLPAKMATTFQ